VAIAFQQVGQEFENHSVVIDHQYFLLHGVFILIGSAEGIKDLKMRQPPSPAVRHSRAEGVMANFFFQVRRLCTGSLRGSSNLWWLRRVLPEEFRLTAHQ
jgi:hypothetical protein